MALLRRIGSDETFLLGPRCLLGRHASCDLRVEDPRVSGEHAVIHHSGVAWELRDLGSRNGTFIGKRRIAPGEKILLDVSAQFAVGGRDIGFVLIDAEPPVASARHVHTGEVRVATDGLLVLPNEEQPAVTVFEASYGRWVAEGPNTEGVVTDREVLIVDGEGWRLELPTWDVGTLDTARIGPTLDTVSLRFAVSLDEEHVELFVLHDGLEKRLASRSYHYLLLTLARARLADLATGGWVDRETLCRTSADLNRLNTEVFRAREQLGSLGIHGAAKLVERRPETGQLRIGIDRIEIAKL